MKKNKSILFFFTASFPYGNDETFIETEILYLSKAFKKVIIISHDLISDYCRDLPENIDLIRIRYHIKAYEKIFAISFLFSKIFWKEINIITNDYNQRISFGIIKTLLMSIQNAKRLARTYSKIYKQCNYNNSIFYSYWMNDSAIALSMIKGINKSDFLMISKMHRWDIYFEESKYNYLPLRKFVIENLSSIFSISQDGIQYACNKSDFSKSKFKLSRLGIENHIEFSLINSTNFTIISCSNVIKVKRVKLIAEALNISSLNNIKWIHYGDGNLLDEIKNYCNQYLVKRIDFNFPGRVPNFKVISSYKENKPSLFINLSSSEGVPVSIMEAMSFGIPVIATNVGGNSEIVNERNGYLIEPNPSPELVANKLNKFYNLSIEEKNEKRKASYDTWNEKYNAKKNYKQFVSDVLGL